MDDDWIEFFIGFMSIAHHSLINRVSLFNDLFTCIYFYLFINITFLPSLLTCFLLVPTKRPIALIYAMTCLPAYLPKATYLYLLTYSRLDMRCFCQKARVLHEELGIYPPPRPPQAYFPPIHAYLHLGLLTYNYYCLLWTNDKLVIDPPKKLILTLKNAGIVDTLLSLN
jgi:hypothetical protein